MNACPTVTTTVPMNLRLPRYTSYPTAPHFSAAVGRDQHAAWLSGLGQNEPVSVYIHIPFCAELCYYCGCQTSVVRNYTPIAAYVDNLLEEIAQVSALIGRQQIVSHIHFGGGSPDMLHPDDFTRIMTALDQVFVYDDETEIAIEIDPRVLKPGLAQHLARLGFTRASLGVQDFDPGVQAAIGRVQSVSDTREAVRELRAAGFKSINLDLVYGLPKQTVATLSRTVARALSLGPDRIALFGYAHVPWVKKHQQLIREEWLPASPERLEQFETATRMLTEVGMVAIGLDHFALPGDSLAIAADAHKLHRNFQGYTTDRAKVLIGLGASSISQFPAGYAQNAPSTPAWSGLVQEGKLPTVRGYVLTADDRARADIIEQILCNLEVDIAAVAEKHGVPVADFRNSLLELDEWENNGTIYRHRDYIKVNPSGRVWLRHIASAFDAYLDQGNVRHALAV